MNTPPAYALLEVADLVVVLCPHCNALHNHPATIGRMTITPAPCNSDKAYKILLTLKEKSYVSAMKGYIYEKERKRVAYQKKRALAMSSSSSSSDST